MASALSVRRFWITNLIIASLFVIIGYQLIQLGVIRRASFMELADKQHLLSIEIPPMRGQILDRNGKEMATNLKVPSIYAIPRLIADNRRQEMIQQVSKILNLKESFVAERLSRDKAFVWLKRRASYDEAEKIRKLKSPVLGIEREYRRFYPQGDLLAQILGFTDIDNTGLEGIEMFLNRELQGRAGRRYTRRDAKGREIKAFEIKAIPAVDGHSVTLTIDQYMQYLAERALDRAFTQWKAKGATAIVMEADTGKILALANRPTFDPNYYEKSVTESRRNRTITDMYEPGSVFKIVTASAVLNENKVTPETMFNCENGQYHYGSHILHDVHSYGMLPFADVITKSSNIGTVKAAAMIPPATLQGYIERFGFGKATGMDLPGEAGGYSRPVQQWSKTSPYNIPIGQEILVTPLQMTVAMAVIANGGKWVKPYIISEVRDVAGIVLRKTEPVIKRQVIRPETAAIMRDLLVRVVNEGTGTKAKIDGIPVGGKTGTAQKILANGRGYSHNNFMASFVGFAPAENPKFVMTVVLDDPKPLYYGGTVSAPVFKEVMETALFAMGYAPAIAKKVELVKPAGRQELPKNPPTLRPVQAAGKAF